MKDADIEELVSLLIKARDAYYIGDPIMSDEEYDALEQKLKKNDPENKYFDIVGSEQKDADIQHNFPMLSVDNIKYPKPVDIWYRRINIRPTEEVISTPKIDGCACTLVYKEHEFAYAATRGDGTIGKIIHFGKRYDVIKHMPLNGTVEVRGELYIPRKYGKTVFKDTPLRNRAAGIIRSGEDVKYLEFIAYQLLTDAPDDTFKKESEVLDFLSHLQFDTAPYSIAHSIQEVSEEIQQYIVKKRDMYPYETDGLVLTVNNRETQRIINSTRTIRSFHYHNLAVKPPSKIAKTKLLDVECNISKSGRLIPVMIFEPVQIDNVIFERATLNNFEYLKSFGSFYVGNTVHIMRGNEVISVVVDMKEDGNKNLPINFPETECPVCGTTIIKEGKHLVCPNQECPGRMVSTIYNWVVKRNMKNIGLKFLELAYEKGIIRSMTDLYEPSLESKIEKLDRFIPSGGRVNKIIAAIEKSKENVSDIDILESIGIPGIGRSVLENLNINSIETLPSVVMGKNNFEIRDSIVLQKDSNKNPSDLAVYRYISQWLQVPGNYAMLLKLKKILKSRSYSVDKNEKTVCITGTFTMKRLDLEKLLRKKGYKVSSHVTKDTEYLVVGENSEGRSKLEKAKDLGTVKIVDIKEIL